MPSEHFLEQAQADNATDPFLWLLTIDHPDLDPEIRPMRYVRDWKPLVSREMTFQPFPFDVTRPGDTEDARTPARISIDNVDQRIVAAIRSLATPPTMLLELVVASTPDVVEESMPVFEVSTVTGDRFKLQGDLTDNDDDGEPLNKWSFTPSLAPALFA